MLFRSTAEDGDDSFRESVINQKKVKDGRDQILKTHSKHSTIAEEQLADEKKASIRGRKKKIPNK